MEARELRIGNLVFELDIDYDAGGNKIIDSSTPTIRVVDLYYFNEVLQDLANEGLYQPIPLTEEWLVKFGFEEEYRSEWTIKFTHENKHEFGYDWNKTFEWRFRYYGHHIDCKYVHTLQNLYFALTGIELIIPL